jgi:protein-S-isoprenylcysteine O-methyltransferase Ste14
MPLFRQDQKMNAADSKDLFRELIAQTIIWLAITAALLFVSAGTVRWPEAWAYLGIWFAGAVISGSSLARKNPDILKERLRSPRQQTQQKSWDRPLFVSIIAGWIAFQIVAGLDAIRYGWSHMPLVFKIAGGVALALGIYVFHVVMLANSYASAVVKVDTERGHRVITTGPYARVRHPMYSGGILYFFGSALLLGSWCAFAIGIVLIAVLALRAKWEEDMLEAELQGYSAYARQVKYRMIPGIW